MGILHQSYHQRCFRCHLGRLLAHHPPGNGSIRYRQSQDFVGLLLSAGIWVSFCLAFTMAGGQWPWNDGRTITTIVVFAVILVLYALQQVFSVFTAKELRSLPLHLLKSKSQLLFCISTASNITSLFVVVYFIPIYFQFMHGDTALWAAVRLLPYVIVNVTFNLGAGHLLSKLKYYMPLFVVSGVFITVGSSLLTAYLDPATPPSYIYGFTVITAVGSGLGMQIGYAVSTAWSCSLRTTGSESNVSPSVISVMSPVGIEMVPVLPMI